MRAVMIAMLVVGGLAGDAAGQAAVRDPAVAVAERFLTHLREGRWDSAGAMVSPVVPTGRLGAAQLETIWGQLSGQVGALKTVTYDKVTALDTLRTVELIGEFAAQRLLVRVVVGPSGISGLWFAPAPVAPDASPPPYADRTKFREEDVVVGAAPWQLPGTVSVPVAAGKHAAVVLVHGSGPNDRDETVGQSKPFRDLAWGLATQGVVVLRYDKRTRVHGERFPADGTVEQETIEDALAAVARVRAHPAVDPARVYVVGHSLGGVVGPEIAQRDGRLAGLILLAAPARDLVTLMEAQLEYLSALPLNAGAEAQAQIRTMLDDVRRVRVAETADTALVMGARVSYWRDLMKRQPIDVVRRLDTPVLVLHGERDYQVPVVEHRMWGDALAGRPHATVRLFPGLNHLFIAGTGAPSPAEYNVPGHVSIDVVNAIRSWIRD